MITLTTEEIDRLPSRHFEGYDWSEHKPVNELIDLIFEDYSKWARESKGQQRIKQQAELKTHFKCLLLELYRTYKISPDMALAISLGNETISSYQGDRYKPGHLTYRLMNHAFDFLAENDYIELPLGVKGRATGAISHQRATRARATERCISTMDFFGINKYMITSFPGSRECIVLRRTKQKRQTRGDDEQYKDTDFTSIKRENLNTINSFIAKHCVNLKISDAQEYELNKRIVKRSEDDKPNYLDFTQTWLRRIFNNSSFEEGGRFYGGLWQLIPKEYRFLITINEDKTREYDFSGMHFSILYSRVGQELPDGDVYELNNYPKTLRSDIKRGFNIILNSSTVAQAIGAIDQKIKDGDLHPELIDGKTLLESFKTKHKPIAKYIASGEGVRLQFIDSEIAESVLLQGVDRGICILPIHDGFITSVKYEAELQDFMQNAFNDKTGIGTKIKAEPIYPNLIHDSSKGLDSQVQNKNGDILRASEFNGEEAIGYSSIVDAEHVQEELIAFKNYYKREREWAEAVSS